MADQVRIHSEKAPAAVGPYSQAVMCDGFLFVSGQIPLDPATGELVQGNIEAQVRRIIQNMEFIVKEAGGELKDIVKTKIFLMDMQNFALVNSVYAEYFGDILPARSAVQVAGLPLGAQVEMEAIARIPDESPGLATKL